MTLTYHHKFQSGQTATAQVTDDPPGFEVKWSARPSWGMIAEYFRWRGVIMADFEKQTGKKVLILNLQ